MRQKATRGQADGAPVRAIRRGGSTGRTGGSRVGRRLHLARVGGTALTTGNVRTIVVAAALLVTTALPARAGGDGSWHLTGRISATACSGGRCTTRGERVDKTIVVTNGEISNIGELGALCDTAVTIQTSDLGEYVPARRGWLRFRLTNRRLLRDLFRECLGYRNLVVTGFGDRVRPSPDGQSFVERTHISVSVVVQGHQVNVSAGGRLRGELVTSPLTRWADPTAPVSIRELVEGALVAR